MLGLPLVLIVVLPKARRVGGPAEDEELWAFLCEGTVGTIGEALGLWQMRDGYAGMILGASIPLNGLAVRIQLLNPTRKLSRERAAQLSGTESRVYRLVAVGLGAIGSQVFMNLARSGYGDWTLIDDDQLLPHNLARHALDGHSLGGTKAIMLAGSANATIDGSPIATPLVADVLAPGTEAERVAAALDAAETIVDMTASLAVARHLARDVVVRARRLSLFLNPAGSGLVLLAEDRDRQVPLDWLEMLYYRQILREQWLAGHLRAEPGRVRYARTCRDVSSTMPQEVVALFAATGSRGLRRAIESPEATIAIWEAQPDDLSVRCVPWRPTIPMERHCDGWTILTDGWLLDTVMQARSERLPNETGGVLVGCFDAQRRIVYVIDSIPSPPDSTEWPTLYIRGCAGLSERIREIHERTGGMVRYVGEWHSHPVGHDPLPSQDDQRALAWLGEHMGLDGYPGIMLIAGDHTAWHVSEQGNDTPVLPASEQRSLHAPAGESVVDTAASATLPGRHNQTSETAMEVDCNGD
jgi:hypothetical protein